MTFMGLPPSFEIQESIVGAVKSKRPFHGDYQERPATKKLYDSKLSTIAKTSSGLPYEIVQPSVQMRKRLV
jgi:hypothetical protein